MADDIDGLKIKPEAAWITDEIRARRKAAARLYASATGEIEELIETGQITALVQGRRVLLRAILPTDVSAMAQGVLRDMRQAVAHEILAFGPGCEKWWDEGGIPADKRPKVGQHCFVITAAVDLVSKRDRECRLCSCRIDDVTASWDVPTL